MLPNLVMLIPRREAKVKPANRHIRFVESSSWLIRDSRIPLFSSELSKRTYTQHQLLVLLLLKEYLSEDYRDIVELTEIMDSLRVKINLKEIPHSTTNPQVLSTDPPIDFHPVTQPADKNVL